jgi:hypothetical protein
MMQTLRFKGFPHTGVYRGPLGTWKKGEQHEVSEEGAAYLLETFGEAFEAVGSAPAKPANTRAVKSPVKRRSTAKPKATK